MSYVYLDDWWSMVERVDIDADMANAQFKCRHPLWVNDDYQSYGQCYGSHLPCMVDMVGGTILFCTKEQKLSLDEYINR